MVIGSVHPSGEAIVPVRMRGPGGATAEFRTLLDTGFSEWLTLSRPMIESLALAFREEGRFVLADGSEVVSRLFAAEVEWFGRWRQILVVEMEGGPLLGMSMLRGFYTGVEVIDGGRVEIQPLGA